MKKIKWFDFAKTFLFSGMLLTIACYTIYYGLNWPLVVGFGIPSGLIGLRLALGLLELSSYRRRNSRNDFLQQQYSRSIPVNANGRQGNLFLHVVPSIFDSKPRSAMPVQHDTHNEFMFYDANMSSVIYESQLFEFVKVAWRRQQRYAFGDLSANQIFSRRHFTQVYPRIAPVDYEAMMYILMSRALIAGGRWQGKGGKLRFTPRITVDLAKSRWNHATSTGFGKFFRFR